MSHRWLAQALLHCYPPFWRRRYADEMASLLDDREVTPSTLLDLARSCADAWLNPEEIATSTPGATLQSAALIAACAIPPFTFALIYWAWLVVSLPSAASPGSNAADLPDLASAVFWSCAVVAALAIVGGIGWLLAAALARRAATAGSARARSAQVLRPPLLVAATYSLFAGVATAIFFLKNAPATPSALARLDGALTAGGLAALVLTACTLGIAVLVFGTRACADHPLSRRAMQGVSAAAILMTLALGLAALQGLRTVAASLSAYPWLDLMLMAIPALLCVLAARRGHATSSQVG